MEKQIKTNLFERFLRNAETNNVSRYHYRITPSLAIVDDNLMNLKRKFDIYSLMGLSAKLTENGYYSLPESFASSELTEFVDRELDGLEYMDGLVVHNVGWTPEHLGLRGVVARFTRFVKFIDYNLPYGDYVITDDYGDKVTLRVIDGECSIVDM